MAWANTMMALRRPMIARRAIKKVYTIWIAMTSPDNKSHINSYQLTEKQLLGSYRANPADYQLINILLIYLGNYRTGNKMLELLRLIFKKEIAAAEKRKELSKDYNIELINTDETELMTMCNLSEGIFERGIAKGRAEGILEGKAIGNFEGLRHSVQSMMKRFGISAKDAIAALELSPEDSKRLAAMLN